MTGAQRQARYRASRIQGKPVVKFRCPVDRRSRPQRWQAAVEELLELQESYQAWLDSLPENLQEGSTAQALQAICDLDLSELESAEPPRGFGRD